jgi:hypothetical protein
MLTIASAVAMSGCSRKSTTDADAAADAGADAGDGGTDGATASSADSGVDDLALPSGTGDELVQRMRHLLEAIAQNDAGLSGDVLFPRDGYVTSRDSSDPQKDWEKHVAGIFRRAIARTHAHTKGIENAKFTGFELGHAVAQTTPRKHDWKRPLWRVKHSKLMFTIDGKARHLEIAELTAWRGAWYVTRLR